MSENSTAVAETATAIAGKVTTATGTGVTLVSWYSSLDWGFIVGVGIGVAGLLISFFNFISNRQFQKRKDKREQMEEERKQELHRLQLKKLEGLCDAKQD